MSLSNVKAYLLFSKKRAHEISKENEQPEVDGFILKENENETDSLPSHLTVEVHHFIGFIFSIVSYFFDFCTDILAIVVYFVSEEYGYACVMLAFIVPSMAVTNILSYQWLYYDERNQSNNGLRRTNSNRYTHFLLRILKANLGPVWWNFKAVQNAWKFKKESDQRIKKRLFCQMIEAERDATLLRVIEAFLESAPQVVFQSVILVQNYKLQIKSQQTALDIELIQLMSIIISVISMGWAFCCQHRTLRMVRMDKINIHPIEILLLFVWRLLTMSSRFIFLVLLIVFFEMNAIWLLMLHSIVSSLHIIFLQNVSIEGISKQSETVLTACNIVIHTFSPFNAVDGPAKYRYITAFTVEFIEALLLFSYLWWYDLNSMDALFYTATSYLTLFFSGIFSMVIYYRFLHPNRRKLFS